ncbi:MAG: diguanylate cyclase [Candidatus Competibacteraceae bacterium]|nr:diguanylate cyclase [Candidatus Competibacteraceae bacterium]
MAAYTIDDIERADTNHAVQIADRVWWVGHRLKNDVFQCHVYLIEQGDQSILFDPGSVLTFRQTLRKIEEVIPFSHIRYFVCHHQDPDITGALPLIDQLIDRDDAVLVTHWRAQMLIKHYGIRLPFWLVDANDWKLMLPDRRLDFIFTPYAHFPGAICTFDSSTGVLFSSDIFGGLTSEFALVAKDEHYFEAMRPFHEHYMPSRDILDYALSAIERHPIRMIAPQHGSIIPEHLIRPMIDKLKTLDCGLYLIARGDTDIQRLLRINQALRDITSTMLIHRDFRDIASSLLAITQRVLPVVSLEFYARLDHRSVLNLSAAARHSGLEIEPPAAVARILDLDQKQWNELNASSAAGFMLTRDGDDAPVLMLPLFSPDKRTVHAVAIVALSEAVTASDELRQIVEQISVPLQVAVEREVIHRKLDLERQRVYEQSIRDPLTGLFTRAHMREVVQRLCDIQDRGSGGPVTVMMMDIDHFKPINDGYGHHQGDIVLHRIAEEILHAIRASDIPVRLGGDELAIFSLGEELANIASFAERLRARIAELNFGAPLSGRSVTLSLGVAVRQQRELLLDFIQRADTALYDAKNAGRNRVCFADDSIAPDPPSRPHPPAI